MTFNATSGFNNINSAIISSTLGFERAQRNISDSARDIAANAINVSDQNRQPQTIQDLLANTATQQLGQINQLLPSGGDSLTNNILSLQISRNNGLASAKVLDIASGTVGRIIDELA